MSDKTSYYQENREEILNCVKKYYEDRKKSGDRKQEISTENLKKKNT